MKFHFFFCYRKKAVVNIPSLIVPVKSFKLVEQITPEATRQLIMFIQEISVIEGVKMDQKVKKKLNDSFVYIVVSLVQLYHLLHIKRSQRYCLI